MPPQPFTTYVGTSTRPRDLVRTGGPHHQERRRQYSETNIARDMSLTRTPVSAVRASAFAAFGRRVTVAGVTAVGRHIYDPTTCRLPTSVSIGERQVGSKACDGARDWDPDIPRAAKHQTYTDGHGTETRSR
jgi:hypothetical protein